MSDEPVAEVGESLGHLGQEDVGRVVDEPLLPDSEAEVLPQRKGLRRILPAPVWRVGRFLLVALLLEYLVLPQLAGPRKVLHLLTDVNPLLLLAGLGLEGAALYSYTELTRAVLPSGLAVTRWTIFRIQMTTLSISHCTPGGSATGTAMGYRLYKQAGVSGGDVGFALATVAIGSAVVLNVMLWVALIVSIPVWGFSAVYLLAAIVGAVLLSFTAGLVLAFTRGGDHFADSLERAASRLPFVDGVALRGFFLSLATKIVQLGRDRKMMTKALGWAAANWLLDAASLAVFVGAFGKWVNPDGLLVAYGLANVLAVIPISPGGLGVVEATLTSLLVGFGTPRGVATLGVVAYRLVNFWLPIPLGGLTYLSLHVGAGSPGGGLRGRLVRRSRRRRTEGLSSAMPAPGEGSGR